MTQLELLTVGRISIDLYCGQLGAGWHEAETFAKAVGGSPTNVAIAAARLGRRAALYTKVGADPFGDVAVQELRDFGVDTTFVGAWPDGVTPLAFAVLDPPEDPQLHFRRQPPVPDFQLQAGEVPDDVVTDIGVLWISGGALAQEPCRGTVLGMLAARGRRSHTVLDLDYRPSFWRDRAEASQIIGAAVDHATIAVGNREECAVAVGTEDPHEAAAAVAGARRGAGHRQARRRRRAPGRPPRRAHRGPGADPGAVRPGRGRRLRWRAVSRAALGLAGRAGRRLRQRGRRDRGLAAAVLGGDAV